MGRPWVIQDSNFRRNPANVENVRNYGCNRYPVSPFAGFIKHKFRGTHICLTIVGDEELYCGEVVDGCDDIVALKRRNGVTTFINAAYISTFV